MRYRLLDYQVGVTLEPSPHPLYLSQGHNKVASARRSFMSEELALSECSGPSLSGALFSPNASSRRRRAPRDSRVSGSPRLPNRDDSILLVVDSRLTFAAAAFCAAQRFLTASAMRFRPNEYGRVYNFAQSGSNLAIPANSNLKRPRTLPNRSREDRIRDGPFERTG